MYKHLLRPILFQLNPEKAHNLTMICLSLAGKIPFARNFMRFLYKRNYPNLKREVFGIEFPNPVGLAGGLDKNGDCYNELSDLGFGFVEIGSLTPKPQDGNPRPRLFRVPKDKAIINRMGINNKGVIHAIEHIKAERPDVIIAANIAKNTTSTTDEQIAADYDTAFTLLYDYVDMFVINVSCPNVEGLTSLQDGDNLQGILDPILDRRVGMDKMKPVCLKLSPDIEKEQLDYAIKYAMQSGIDAIIAGNTTRKRTGLTIPEKKIADIGNGGMSGAPLFERSLEMVKYIHEKSEGRIPIIGVGGIMSPKQAKMMLDAGASLIEIYSGFIYEGPGFVKRILDYISGKKS